MNFALKILQKHLDNERKWLSYQSIAATDLKIKAGVQMASVRIPQLEQAIEVLKKIPVNKKRELPMVSKPKIKNQISLFDIFNKSNDANPQL
jgi:hypothetical protein